MQRSPEYRPTWEWKALIAAGALLLIAAAFILLPAPAAVQAAPQPQSDTPADNTACLGCHSSPGQTVPLPNGEELPLYVEAEAFNQSVHGHEGVACTACHTDISGFPHPEKTAQDRRDYTLQQKNACQSCHADQYEKTMDSVHQKALDAGDRNAPVCTDCHDPHKQGKVKDENGKLLQSERANIPNTCANCHSAIYDQYAQSVHGTGILQNNNPDVPTCVDCHGIHQISDPNAPEYRVNSPQICAKCHTDASIMDKYGLSTEVMNTYVADFHGTTVTLFEKQSPDQVTNKPVCYDCHGVHDIRRTNDPQKGLQVRKNMLATCQKCHPDATDSFSDSWLSHYIPSKERAPLVYYVNLFYKFFIPAVIGGMLIFVLSDIYRHLKNRGKPQAPETIPLGAEVINDAEETKE